METRISEIADGIYRVSTYMTHVAPPAGFTFNQFLVKGDEPLLFHCGMRGIFPLVSAAVAKIVPVDSLRWLSFGHVAAGEGLDLGGKRVRYIDTPHVPHCWEAGVVYEETTGTLLCGDLLTHVGDAPALTDKDIIGPAVAAEDMFHATSTGPATSPTT